MNDLGVALLEAPVADVAATGTCGWCQTPLTGRQLKWCKPACKSYAVRARKKMARLRDNPRNTLHVACGYCGGPLTGLRVRWCSDECKTRGQARVRTKFDHATKKCVICDKSLTGQRRVVYCGRECYREGAARRSVEVNQERQKKGREGRTCGICDNPLPKYKKAYCSTECAWENQLDLHREYRAARAAKAACNTSARKSSVSVGDCRWCQALHAETIVRFAEEDPEAGKFSINGGECGSCYDKRKKKQTCAKCSGPMSRGKGRNAGCIRCDPAPVGFTDLIILNDADQRERIIRRPIYDSTSTKRHGSRNGKVKVWRYLFKPREGLTVTLPLKIWTKER